MKCIDAGNSSSMFKAYHKYTIRCAFTSRFTRGKRLLPTGNPLYTYEDFPVGNLLRGISMDTSKGTKELPMTAREVRSMG